MMLSTRLIITFVPLLFIYCFQWISNYEFFPLSFTDLGFIGNEVSKSNIDGVAKKKETKDVNTNFIYESSVYVSSMKPIGDQSFKLLKLNNNIEVILNSAPSVEDCEVSILNRVGSIHDPSDLHGLGFYLMNVMLSANSDTGPGLYDFTIDHSSSIVYEVYSTYSIFYVTTATTLFENVLRLSSEMFINPVFTDEVLKKALTLLEKKTTLDNHSYNNFLTNLVLSDPKSIFTRNKFGNRDTLETIPKSKMINIKQSLIKFFKEQYSSNRMILSLKSSLSIQAMQDLVTKYFIEIPNKNLPVNDQHKTINILAMNPLSYSVGKILYKIDDLNQSLQLFFPLKNYLLPYMKSGPLFFISTYICEDREGTLMRFLKQKKFISNMDCYISNDMSGFTNVQFSFRLTNSGIFNIQNIIRAFFFSINKIKGLKLDLNIYKKTRQNLLTGIKSSSEYFKNLNSLSLLNNYFRYKSSAFKSLLLGINEFADFDINLHRQILMEITPQNMIIIFSLKGDKEKIEDTSELTLFDQSIINKDCTKYEEFLNNYKSFRYVVLTNVLSTEFKGVVKTNDKFRFILEEQNFCLKKYFTHFPESLNQELKIQYEKKDIQLKASLEKYDMVQRLAAPTKLSSLLSSNSSQRAANFSQFKDFYYFIPHSTPTHMAYLAINFFFPFENRKLASMRSIRIATILLFIKEILLSYSESVTSHFAKHNAEFVPKISLPDDSIVNAFGISLLIGSVPGAFSNFLSNLSANLNSYINLEENTFQEFHVYFKKILVETSSQPSDLLIEFVRQINLNHKISTETLLNEAQTLTVEEVRKCLHTIFKQSQISGVIYGNLTPIDAENHLSKLFSDFIGETPKKKTLRFKSSRKPRISTRLRCSRMLTKLGSKRARTRKILVTKRKSNLTINKPLLTKKTNKAINIESEIPSRSKLYKLYSSAFSKSNSDTCKNLQILDMSSIKPNSKFFIYSYTNDKTRNLSILWIYIDKKSPESFIFTEYLKYIVNNRLISYQKNHSGIHTSLKDYKISSSSYFISIEGYSSSEDSSAINNLLSSYLDTFFSLSSSIFNQELFNSAKEFLIKKYKKEGHVLDSSISKIFEEIVNKRFDFVKFRSIVSLLSQLTFENFTLNLKKIHKSTFSIIYSISFNKSQPVVPNGFVHFASANDIFKLSGIKTFKPAYSRADKQLSNLS
ncbi:secreted insulinase like peptidase [Cryptosporidium sp. chipmunk genotype I]|uniref:secreted insulinase like peptidase n=1 Tax=Cryptosporidium sp. chipmunk genotype I TaxID=1280935 RepID=UPI00351A24B7|nr:secreted insulinase like peptidase [Cryptosporidium sp. chipmunk genotype I]